MVNAITVRDAESGKFFYGTRRAKFRLSLSQNNLGDFTRDLEREIFSSNEHNPSRFGRLSVYQREGSKGVRKYEKIIIPSNKSIKGRDLTAAFNLPYNVLVSVGDWNERDSHNLIAQFVASFIDKENHRNRILEIHRFGIPNYTINFDPSFLYNLGRTYGQLLDGENFDISLNNYVEINNA